MHVMDGMPSQHLPKSGTIGKSGLMAALAACHLLLGRPSARCTNVWSSLQATDLAPGKNSFNKTGTGSCILGEAGHGLIFAILVFHRCSPNAREDCETWNGNPL